MPYLLYPLLLCLMPVHSLYAQNLAEISKDSYFKTIGAIASILVFGYGLLFFITHNSNISAFLLCSNFFLLLYANYFFIGMFSLYKRTKQFYKLAFSASYILICTGLSLILYFLFKDFNLDFLNKILFYISLAISFFIFLDILKKLDISKQAIKTQSKESGINKSINNTSSESLPDIYHILLDAHSGFVNKELCDNEFKIALESRGFHIYEDFMCNYPNTAISLPSMFNIDYIDKLIKNQNAYPASITYPLYAENFVYNEFKRTGYKCNLFINKFLQSIFTQSNLKSKFKNENSLKKLMIFSSIIKSSLSITFKNYLNNFKELLDGFAADEIDDYPQYKFMHALAPHNPYFFDEFGNKIDPSGYIDSKNYFSYMKYVDKNIVELIDKIKSKMNKNSIIIIHSDHGLNISNSCWNILCAVYFPNQDDYKCIPENGTLVNLFRYLFNKIFSANYKILDNLYYSHNSKNDCIKEIENPDYNKRQLKNE